MSRFNADDRVVDPEGNEAVCMWFLKCTNPANGLRPHPILVEVPTCQRCDDKMEALNV
jgi:hypothetical protein